MNITGKNIGKYKGNNTVVFINENYIPQKNEENKNKLIDANQQLQNENENHYNKNNTKIIISQSDIKSPYFIQNNFANDVYQQNNNAEFKQIYQGIPNQHLSNLQIQTIVKNNKLIL